MSMHLSSIVLTSTKRYNRRHGSSAVFGRGGNFEEYFTRQAKKKYPNMCQKDKAREAKIPSMNVSRTDPSSITWFRVGFMQIRTQHAHTASPARGSFERLMRGGGKQN